MSSEFHFDHSSGTFCCDRCQTITDAAQLNKLSKVTEKIQTDYLMNQRHAKVKREMMICSRCSEILDRYSKMKNAGMTLAFYSAMVITVIFIIVTVVKATQYLANH